MCLHVKHFPEFYNYCVQSLFKVEVWGMLCFEKEVTFPDFFFFFFGRNAKLRFLMIDHSVARGENKKKDNPKNARCKGKNS